MRCYKVRSTAASLIKTIDILDLAHILLLNEPLNKVLFVRSDPQNTCRLSNPTSIGGKILIPCEAFCDARPTINGNNAIPAAEKVEMKLITAVRCALGRMVLLVTLIIHGKAGPRKTPSKASATALAIMLGTNQTNSWRPTAKRR